MKKLLLLALLSLASCACRGQDTTLGKATNVGHWSYLVRNDPKEVTKLAMTLSPRIYFRDSSDFTTLFVIQHESGEVQSTLSNEAGRFATSSLGDFVTMKFDNNPMVKWRVTHGNKKSAHILFLTDTKSFYERLLKTTLLQIRIYFEDSVQWMPFGVDGFSMHNVRVKNAEW